MSAHKRAALAISPGNEASLTATYSESAPLDNTHSLVALVFFSGVATDIVSNSWGITALPGSSNNGSANYLGAFYTRGDGTKNSFTITLNSAKAVFKIVLLAFEGFASLTPDSARGVSASGTQIANIAPVDPTEGPNRVMITGITSNGSLGALTGDWTNGFESPIPFTERFLVATGSVPTANTTPSTTSPKWTTDRGLRVGVWVLEGRPATASGADTTPPAITIVSPSDDSQVRGVIDLVATATDNVATAPPTVQFYMGPNLLGTATANGSTYTLSGVDTRQVEDGAYVLLGVAIDAAGNTSQAEFTVLVNNSSAPITTPPGLYFAGKELILPPGVSRFYQGPTRLLGTSPSLPPPTGEPPVVVTPPPTGAPVRVPSYMPDGNHYPERTPWVGAPNAAFDSSEEVECSWAAIGAAITRATNAYPNGNCRILVKPGTLPGYASGSTSTPVLQNLGALGRRMRIVVAPRDGIFSINFDRGFRIHNVKGVSFIGFCPAEETHVEANGGTDMIDPATGKPIPNSSPNALSAKGLIVTNVMDFAWAWSRVTHFNATAANGGSIDGLDIVEVVALDNAISNTDRMGFRNSDGSYMRDVSLIGVWMAPRWRNDGSAHLDTVQTSGNSVRFDMFTWLDCFLSGPSNAVIIGAGDGIEQVNAMTRPFIDHSMIIGGSRASNPIYPFITGPLPVTSPTPQKPVVAMNTGPVALNGQPYKPRVRDSFISGKVVWQFDNLENTKYAAINGPTPISGTPGVDANMFGSLAWFEAQGVKPLTVAKLKEIWRW